MAIVIIGIIIFLAGATTGIMAAITAGIHHEEREFSLTGRTPGRVSRGARLATGLYVRARTVDNPRPDVRI